MIIKTTLPCKVCGRDTDGGGNIQNGCGQSFDWRSAPPYQAEIPDQSAIDRIIVEAPARAEGVVHDCFCSRCRSQISGIRFRCLHCLRFNLCSGCEAVEHTHDKDHVFQILSSA